MKYLKYAILASILLSGAIFIDVMTYKAFGSLAWLILCFIVLIRPVSDVFPNFPILKKGVLLRKELGIACASFGIAHVAGYFLLVQSSPLTIFTLGSTFWGLTNFLTWGFFAFLVSIPLLLTSNLYSMKLLKKNWKPLQRLTYFFFVFTALHVAFIRPGISSFLSNIFPVVVWAIFWVLAYKKITYTENKKPVIISFVLIVLLFIGQLAYGATSRPSMPKGDNAMPVGTTVEYNN